MAVHSRFRWARRAVLAAVTLLLTIVLAGCGAGERGAAAGPVDQNGLQKAKDLITQFSSRPTELNVTAPVGKAIPAGKTVDFISCAAADCNVIAGVLRASAAKLGWTLNVINTDGSPESQQQAFAQVVRDKADGVIYIAIDRSVYERFLPELKANGTWMVSACSNNEPGNGIDYAICTPDQQKGAGKLMAAYMVADSGGQANAVYFNVPAFVNLSKMQDEFLGTMKELCPSCGTATQDIPVTALGNGVPQLIVGYLRAHPEVNYVSLSIDSLASGLPAQLKAAGLDHVKIIGEGGGDTTWQYIKTGDQIASVPSPFVETYLAGLDSIVRHVTGVPQVPSQLARFWVVTKDNVAQTDQKVAGATPVVVGSDRMFHQLWGVS
ncbi:sugar ABC transporter substrate-binding protein [Saccharopolyspora phatthalungensis]|uniref:Ribose transport system substrate-binding protein n=1 Tax=Saccharopolyspora phatthalungensis TaxID=664693 RepID=A0A840Q8S2_9PSEU|nr:substrate-binding domain-containing protein [Saccharopolyspora phatthalungensis]MBB5158932.1 ribose transport system substrate-binding protein [Saccharopolyspora phatthalungensis]